MKAKITCFVLDFFKHKKRIDGNDIGSGRITALAVASPRRKVTIFSRRTSGPCGGRKEGLPGSDGSVTRKSP